MQPDVADLDLSDEPIGEDDWHCIPNRSFRKHRRSSRQSTTSRPTTYL